MLPSIITANDRYSGNNRYSGIKSPDRFSTIAVVACIGMVIIFNVNLHEVDENGEVVLHYIDPDALCNESA